MEKLSRVYVHGVAAQAGYSSLDKPEDQGRRIDVIVIEEGVKAPNEVLGEFHLQLKSTKDTRIEIRDEIHYWLDIVTFNTLRGICMVPHFLIVMLVPCEFREINWDDLQLGQRVWWFDLSREKPSTNATGRTVITSKEKRLTASTMRDWMAATRDRWAMMIRQADASYVEAARGDVV